MFCDGECETKKKKCGMYAELVVKTDKSDAEVVKECVFYATMKSSFRLENAILGLHAAMNSQRNEEVKTGHDVTETIATAFLGMIHAVQGNDDATEKLKTLGAISLGAAEKRKQLAEKTDEK